MKKLALATLLLVGNCLADDQFGGNQAAILPDVVCTDASKKLSEQTQSVLKSYLSDPKFIISLVSIGLAVTSIYLQLVTIGQARTIAQEQMDYARELSEIHTDSIYEMGRIQMDYANDLCNIQKQYIIISNTMQSIIEFVGFWL